jgi:hypothetical protein
MLTITPMLDEAHEVLKLSFCIHPIPLGLQQILLLIWWVDVFIAYGAPK